LNTTNPYLEETNAEFHFPLITLSTAVITAPADRKALSPVC